MCPRKFLGMANRVSIECVRSVLSSAAVQFQQAVRQTRPGVERFNLAQGRVPHHIARRTVPASNIHAGTLARNVFSPSELSRGKRRDSQSDITLMNLVVAFSQK